MSAYCTAAADSRSAGSPLRRADWTELPATDHELTVVIPAFNEEKRLPWTLSQLRSFLDAWPIDYRVLVADDGSSDATASLTESLGPRFSTACLPHQMGKGCATRLGMLRATGQVVAFTDADLPYELSALRTGYQWIRNGQCQVVFGARDLEGSEHLAPRKVSRRIATAVFREVAKWLVSREVTDTQCGLKLFSRRAALEIFSRATINGFAFDAEVVYLTHRLGLRFRRIPVKLINEYASTLSLTRHAIPMLMDVLGLWAAGLLGRSLPRVGFRPEDLEQLDDIPRKKTAA